MQTQDTAGQSHLLQQVEAVKLLLLSGLGKALDEMCEGAADGLTELSQEATSINEQRNYRDCIGIVSTSHARIAEAFRKEVERRLVPDDAGELGMASAMFEVGDLSLQDPSELDRQILLSRITARAETRVESSLRDIRPRLERWAFHDGAPFDPQAALPESIGRSYLATIETLKLDNSEIAALLQLYERLFVPRLGRIYEGLLAWLAEENIEPLAPIRPRAAPPRAAAHPATDSSPEAQTAGVSTTGGTGVQPGFGQGPGATGNIAPGADSFPAQPGQAGGHGVTTGNAAPGTGAQPAQPGAPGGNYTSPPGGSGAGGTAAPTTGETAAGTGAQTGAVASPGTGAPTPQAAGQAGQGTGGATSPPTESTDSQAAPSPESTGAPADVASPLDAQTLSMLQSVSQQRSGGTRYGDSQLAEELSNMASGQPVAGWSPTAAADSLRRAQAIGRVFNEIQSDRNIPSKLKPRFADMRFAVMKSALADARFFNNPKHPVRRLLGELETLAANSRVSSKRGIANISEMLSEIQAQFEVAAEAIKKDQDGDDKEQADEAAINSFIREQKAANQRRRDELIRRSRELVSEELWLRTAQREVSQGARRVCAYGWVPMMALTLLRHGAGSQPWKDGLSLLDQVVEAVDPITDTKVDMSELCGSFRNSLREVGMVAPRIDPLVHDLAQAICNAKPRPGAAAEPAPETSAETLYDRLIVADQWFKVYDRRVGHARWLRAVGHDAVEVRFGDLEGNRLAVPKSQFIEDLLAGRSEPVDPSPAIERELQRLGQN